MNTESFVIIEITFKKSVGFILIIIGTFFFRLKLVSDAMGIFGYIAFLTMISGLYLEESIKVEQIKSEWKYLLSSNLE